MMSGLALRSFSAMLVKSRCGVGMADRLDDLEAAPGSSALSSFAMPPPNAPSSCTIATVFAGLPAKSLMATRLSSALRVTLPKPGAKRNVLVSPRCTI